MRIEINLLITIVSCVVAVYLGIKNWDREKSRDDKSSATELTTVIVKLESISTGVTEIKSDMNNIRSDIKEDHEKIIRLEEQVRQIKVLQQMSDIDDDP